MLTPTNGYFNYIPLFNEQTGKQYGWGAHARDDRIGTFKLKSTFEGLPVTSLYHAFAEYKHHVIDVSEVDTSNITDLTGAFMGCSGLDEIDITSWDLSKVKKLNYTFNRCGKLKTIKFPSKNSFNTNSLEEVRYMFGSCYRLKEIDISTLNFSNVNLLDFMFVNCHRLSKIKLPSNIKNATSLHGTFQACRELTEIDLSCFGNKFASLAQAFYECEKLKSIDLSSLLCNNIYYIVTAFKNCESLEFLNLRNLRMSESIPSECTGYDGMIENCDKLKLIILSDDKLCNAIRNEQYTVVESKDENIERILRKSRLLGIQKLCIKIA